MTIKCETSTVTMASGDSVRAGNSFTVYMCGECSKPKPSPHVIFSDQCICDVAELARLSDAKRNPEPEPQTFTSG